jgi:hypothetical protein
LPISFALLSWQLIDWSFLNAPAGVRISKTKKTHTFITGNSALSCAHLLDAFPSKPYFNFLFPFGFYLFTERERCPILPLNNQLKNELANWDGDWEDGDQKIKVIELDVP